MNLHFDREKFQQEINQSDEKIDLAKVLEAMGVDVIEVSYPGLSEKDFNEISTISKIIHTKIEEDYAFYL